MSYLMELLKKQNIQIKIEELNENQIQFIAILMDAKLNNKIDELYKDLFDNSPILQIMEKRLNYFNLQDKIDKSALIAGVFFEIDNPGVAIAYLIDLLQEYERLNRIITLDEVYFHIYPDGFPSYDSWMQAVDKLIKTNTVKYSYIY